MGHEFKMGDDVIAWNKDNNNAIKAKFICRKDRPNHSFVVICEGGGIKAFDNCEPYKEPPKRKATRWEWVKWASSADALGWVVRSGGSPLYPPQRLAFFDCDDYQRARITEREEDLVWEDFMVEGEQ